MKRILTKVISLFLILCTLSGCSIDKKELENLAFLFKNAIYCILNPYDDFIAEYNEKISPSADNRFLRPEGVSFKRLPLEKRMGYNSLDDNEKALYLLLEEAVDNLDNLVEFKGLKVYHEDFSKVFYSLKYDCPDVFYLYDAYDYFNYDLDNYADLFVLYYTDGSNYDKLNDNWEMEEEAERGAISSQMSSLYNKLTFYKTSLLKDSALETVKYIYETVVTEVSYDTEFSKIIDKYNKKVTFNLSVEEDKREEFTEEELEVCYKYQATSYGALCQRNAVCTGYTSAISLLLNEAEIVNGVCHGIRDQKYYHIWNIVQLNDNYYHLDATNEKPLDGESVAWMLYEFFLCDDEIMRENYEFNNAKYYYTPPACNDKSLYIYDKITYKVQDLYINGINAFEGLVSAAVKNGAHVITYISEKPIYKTAVNQFYFKVSAFKLSVNGITPKLSTTYYHSPDFKEVHFYISY